MPPALGPLDPLETPGVCCGGGGVAALRGVGWGVARGVAGRVGRDAVAGAAALVGTAVRAGAGARGTGDAAALLGGDTVRMTAVDRAAGAGAGAA